MPNILITGASRGLGLGFVKFFAIQKWKVFASCRDPEMSIPLSVIARDYDVIPCMLDVTNPNSIDQLSKTIKSPIDILLNNAGIQGPLPQVFGSTKYSDWDKILDTNVLVQ